MQCSHDKLDLFLLCRLHYYLAMPKNTARQRSFERYREQYMDDVTFRAFQAELIKNPQAGDVIVGTTGRYALA